MPDSAPRGPSMLDDAAAVWAASFSRRPGTWLLGTALLALAANVTLGPTRSLFAVVVAPVLGGSFLGARGRLTAARVSWLLLVAVVFLHVGAFPIPVEISDLPLVGAVAAAGTGSLWASLRRRDATWWDALILAGASVFSWLAAPLAATRESFSQSPGWVVAIVTAAFVASTRAWWAGAIPLAVTAWIRSEERDSLPFSFLDDALAACGWTLVLALAVRTGRAAANPSDGDAASCRLALRVHRRPWTVLCLGAALGPGVDVVSATCSGGSWWSLTGPRGLVGAALLHVALARPGVTSFLGSLAAWSVSVALWIAWMFGVAGMTGPDGDRSIPWEWVFAHGYAPVLIGWIVGAEPVGSRSRVIQAAAILSFAYLTLACAPLASQAWTALHLPPWGFRGAWSAAWRILFHSAVVLAIGTRSRICLALAGGVIMGLVIGPAGLAASRLAFTWIGPGANGASLVGPTPLLGLLSGALPFVPFVLWVAVARRIRSLTPVPAGHPALTGLTRSRHPRPQPRDEPALS